ncbi:hypothetical protein Y032_0004g2048 [Ancylostoma ceylanicum]|nr:hypothetical protein Y032_0004g2048 [Ancylostoma ceylanicum]
MYSNGDWNDLKCRDSTWVVNYYVCKKPRNLPQPPERPWSPPERPCSTPEPSTSSTTARKPVEMEKL